MNDLVTWLRQQLDDDERVAQEAGGGHWPDMAGETRTSDLVHARRHNPFRVLADVDAKRRILDACESYAEDGTTSGADLARTILPLLALPYADRPGYRDEWKL